MTSLRDEVFKLLQDALSDTALVLEVNVFGSQEVLEQGDLGMEEVAQTLSAWLRGATAGLLRVAEEVDKLRGPSPSVSSG